MPAPGAELAQMPGEIVVAVTAPGAGAGAGAADDADAADVEVGADAGWDAAAAHCSGSLPWGDQGDNTCRSDLDSLQQA